ncbi:MAG: Polysaccharide biosynthesis protein [Candidatus Gottesmanbacteria bacterium GW2011_GWC2_39_8]|uniref:Polysaccharide biosynthesis protein n=1 Tax=Candidatus Gottesmanbacteria bacterium GW2011_GWC2_39_8 TaxID=1618450 RepID=A0A0G0S8I1_9BACT|nr:MAG: Polysaccharide biosynthesis protein [Candidatus Gottesmanbacteria bacterium GW2011_GWC2_39_8]
MASNPYQSEPFHEDSLKKRYFFKLFTNIFALVISLATQAIIPRGLGPVTYGNYNFLTNFFQQVFGFLDMGTSTCFYTKLSQRQNDSRLVSFYLIFSAIISIAVLAFVIAAHACSVSSKVWPAQGMFYVYLAAFWGVFAWLSGFVLTRMVDAYGLTVSSEIARVGQKVFGLLLVLLLFFFNRLNLTSFFFFNYATMLFLGVAIILILERKGHSIVKSLWLSASELKRYSNEFYLYSHPLFLFSVVALIAGILDRWLLQYFSGSAEQGFYGLSYMIGSACFIFTGAMTPLLWREFSIAYEKKDVNHMAYLFGRYVPLLYSVAAALACFIAIQADKVIYIMGGRQYVGALWPVIIMAFYPIHQTYGQMNSVVCMAAGQTSLYSKISIIFMVIGVPIGYFLIAPENKMGLNAGATGLAIKMIVMQIAVVNVQLYFNCRFLKLGFARQVRHQIVSVFLLIAFSAFSLFAVDRMFISHDMILVRFLLSGILYASMIAGFFYLKPFLFGLEEKDISLISQFVLRKIGKCPATPTFKA